MKTLKVEMTLMLPNHVDPLEALEILRDTAAILSLGYVEYSLTADAAAAMVEPTAILYREE